MSLHLLEGPPGRPWARLDLSLDTTLSVTSFSDSSGVEDDPGYRKRSLSTSNISLAKSILVLNSLTILNQHLPHGVGEGSHHERPARGEVHYGDREELGPLEPPVGVAVDPVVLSGSRPSPGALRSTVSSMITAT